MQISIFPLESTQTQTNTKSDYTIVFVHMGSAFPSHIDSAIKQARLFNPHCRMILIANQELLERLPEGLKNVNLETVSCEGLPKTSEHQQFCRKQHENEGFWFWTTERFYYIYDLMAHYQLHNVFHLENDNMLYADLENMLPIFQQHYPGIGATFENDLKGIAGFIYINNPEIMQKMVAYFVQDSQIRFCDMELIAHFKEDSSPDLIDYLPNIHQEYIAQNQLRSLWQHTTNKPYRLCNHVEDFQSIFDGAAHGQYIGGSYFDGRPGYVNESCLFITSRLTYAWNRDSKGRKVPFAIYDGKKYPIVNLHIHSKQLHLYSSI